MLKKILGTAGARVINTVCLFIMLIMISQVLGPEGTGLWTMMVLNVTIFALVCDLLTGTVLVYFSSRKPMIQLIFISWFWLCITIALFAVLFLSLGHVPIFNKYVIESKYMWDVLAISLATALLHINYNLLIGKEKIRSYNILFTLHVVLLVALISGCFFILNLRNIRVYVYCECFSSIFTYLLSWGYILPYMRKEKAKMITLKEMKLLLSELFSFSGYAQLSNLITLVNRRLSYFYINGFLGVSALGIYSAGVQLTEGLRVLGGSIATVQYAHIANVKDKERAKDFTLKVLKFSVVFTFFGLLFLLILPTSFYTQLLGSRFEGVKPIVFALSPGVLALVGSMMLSHYFSGLGMIKYNMWASLYGMVFTLFFLVFLMSRFQSIGAAMTTSGAYILVFLYQLIIFILKSGAKGKDFLITKEDFSSFINGVRKLFVSLH